MYLPFQSGVLSNGTSPLRGQSFKTIKTPVVSSTSTAATAPSLKRCRVATSVPPLPQISTRLFDEHDPDHDLGRNSGVGDQPVVTAISRQINQVPERSRLDGFGANRTCGGNQDVVRNHNV